MNDKDIFDLRADSLRDLLVAARRRRLRRRTIMLLGVMIGLWSIGILLDLGRHREHASVVSQTTNVSTPQLDQKLPYIIRTTSGSLVRIRSTAKASSERVTTSSTANVPRIDTRTLADFYPGRGIAVIHNDPEPPRAVFF